MKAHMRAQMSTSHSLMDVRSNFNRSAHMCVFRVYSSLPETDCSRPAQGLCLEEGPVAYEAHPGRPPHSQKPGPGKE